MFMGDVMRLAGAVSILGPLAVYVGLKAIFKYQNNKHIINIEILWVIGLVLYTCVIVYLTIIRRLPPGENHEFDLHLFWSYESWKELDVRWQVYMNIFLFIPFGFFLRERFSATLLIALMLSTCIELSQYIFCLGLCEIDDIAHNTFGALIGCMYYKILDTFWKKVKKKTV